MIVALPVPTPVTVLLAPLPATEATEELLLLQLPPLGPLVIVTDEPEHMLDAPVIAAGDAFTVITRVLTQPSHVVKLIIAVPPATPVIVPYEPGATPTVGSTPLVIVATAILLLLQLPQLLATDTDAVEPAHTVELPLIAPAAPLTVTITFTEQPAVDVNVIDAVPDDTPLTTPDVLPTVATSVLPLLHAPPPLVALLNTVVEPVHTLSVPVIADGSAFTAMDFVR